MKKKIVSMLLVVIMLLTLMAPMVSATEFDQIYMGPETVDMTPPEIMNMAPGDVVLTASVKTKIVQLIEGDPDSEYEIIYCTIDGEEFPVFCLEHKKAMPPTDKETEVDLTPDLQLTEEQEAMLYGIMFSTYPIKTLEELGATSENMALLGTARAVWGLLAGISLDPNDYDQVDQDKFTEIDYQLFAIARKISAWASETVGKLVDIDEGVEPEIKLKEVVALSKPALDVNKTGFVSQLYEVESNFGTVEFKVNLDGAPEGAYVGTLTGEVKTNFVVGEQFKVFVPVTALTESGKFKVEVSTGLVRCMLLRGHTEDTTTVNQQEVEIQDVLVPLVYMSMLGDSAEFNYEKRGSFELKLAKYIDKIIITKNGKEEVITIGKGVSNMPKVDIGEEELNKISIKIIYNIEITNIGKLAGYANEIVDNIPSELKFLEEDALNKENKWEIKDGKLVSNKLEEVLLNPGDTATTQIALSWDVAKGNLGQINNTADITRSSNEWGETPVYHPSEPASIIIAVKTGNIPTNWIAIFVVIAVLAVAVVVARVVVSKKSKE